MNAPSELQFSLQYPFRVYVVGMTSQGNSDTILESDHARALAYWTELAASYELPAPRRRIHINWADVAFAFGLLCGLTVGLLWAWQPAMHSVYLEPLLIAQNWMYGLREIVWGSIWSLFFIAFVAVAWWDTHRR